MANNKGTKEERFSSDETFMNSNDNQHQCDQMMELKVVLFIFPNVARHVSLAVFTSSVVFQRRPKVGEYWATFANKIEAKTFQK